MILPMDKYDVIKRYQNNESLRSIARSTGIDRKTVTRYCREYDQQLTFLEKGEISPEDFQEHLLSKPKYVRKKRRNHKYTEAIDKLLDELLASEARKDQLLGNHKQKLSKRQLFELIIEAGHDIGESTISNKINQKRLKAKECFIRQIYEHGDRLEFDFGEVKLMVDNEMKKYYMAVLSSPSADFRWAYLYNNQKKEVFQDAHVKFFEMMGGVYREVVYDNMKNVVAKFLGKNEKVLNEDLIKLSVYYGFDINVTNAFSGNEKGHVEGSVKIIRKAVFATKYEFLSYEQACEHLNHELIKLNEYSKIEAEKGHLLPYKPVFDLAEIRVVTINKYSFARIMNNSYSVPDYLVQRKIIAKIYHDEIKFYSNDHFVCKHKKVDGKNQTCIDIRHYIKTFKRKPGAIRHSLALKTMPQLKTIYDVYFNTNPKEFIGLLDQYKDLKYDELLRRVKSHATLDEAPSKKEAIQLITQNQLTMYNSLSIAGRRH